MPEKPPSLKRRPGLIERLAVIAGLAITPTPPLPGDQVKGANSESIQRQQDRQDAVSLRERIARYHPASSGDTVVRPPSSVSEGSAASAAEAPAQRTPESIETDAREVGEAAMHLFDESHTAAENFDDVGTYIRTQSQDRQRAGYDAFEVSAFIHAATASAYARIAEQAESLRQHQHEDQADALETAFESWDPTPPIADRTTTVEDGVTIETTTSSRLIRLPTIEDTEEDAPSEDEGTEELPEDTFVLPSRH